MEGTAAKTTKKYFQGLRFWSLFIDYGFANYIFQLRTPTLCISCNIQGITVIRQEISQIQKRIHKEKNIHVLLSVIVIA